MELKNLFPVLFFTVFAGVVVTFVYRIFKYGGFKAALFEAPITRTVGEVAGNNGSMIKSAVKVHILGDASSGNAVGLELVARSVLSYQMLPISLSNAEANRLIALLQEAVRNN